VLLPPLLSLHVCSLTTMPAATATPPHHHGTMCRRWAWSQR
jgi:hypothetical protein